MYNYCQLKLYKKKCTNVTLHAKSENYRRQFHSFLCWQQKMRVIPPPTAYPILPDDILGYIDSDLLLSLLPLADLSSANLEFIDAENMEHIDEAALAQQQVCII